MDNTKPEAPYAITVKTAHDEINRQYASLDGVLKVVDAIKNAHMPLLAILDEPIVIVNVKDIISITITGASADDIIQYRQKKMTEEHEARKQQYLNMSKQNHLDTAQGALIGSYGSGII